MAVPKNNDLVIDLDPPAPTIKRLVPGWITGPVGVATFVACWLVSGRSIGEFLSENSLAVFIGFFALMFLSAPSHKVRGRSDTTLTIRAFEQVTLRLKGLVAADVPLRAMTASPHWYQDVPAVTLNLGPRTVTIAVQVPINIKGVPYDWPGQHAPLPGPPDHVVGFKDWFRLTDTLQAGGLLRANM